MGAAFVTGVGSPKYFSIGSFSSVNRYHPVARPAEPQAFPKIVDPTAAKVVQPLPYLPLRIVPSESRGTILQLLLAARQVEIEPRLMTENAQIRHAAKCTWPSLFRRDEERIRLEGDLRGLGYTGTIGSLSARRIVLLWKELGWVHFSPDEFNVRISDKGKEQWEAWNEEDRIWSSRDDGSPALPKRLVAGEPALNLRKLGVILGNTAVVGIHDPYMRSDSLVTLLKLYDLGVVFSPDLRILGSSAMKPTERIALVDFLKDVNNERSARWTIKMCNSGSKPHRRFIVLDDGSVVTCGMSLNHIDKDEVLDRLGSGDQYARHDCKYFDDQWNNGTPI